jgi:hypothetical protein
VGPSAPVPAAGAEPTTAAVRVHVEGDPEDPRVAFLRGAAAVRVLEHGDCLTRGAADIVVSIEVARDATTVAIDDGTSTRRHAAPGGDSLAALEVLHRIEAGLRDAAPTSVHGPACRDAAIGVRAEGERDSTWIRDWISGLSGSGRSVVRAGHADGRQVCLRREDQVLVVGHGAECDTAVRIAIDQRSETDRRPVDQAVGAALALTTEAAAPHDVETADSSDDAPAPELPPPSPADAPHPPTAPPRTPRPRATLHAMVAGGPAIRPGGLDGAALLVAGANFGPGVLAAAEVTIIGARLRERLVAVDTDVMASLGYRLPLAKRSGIRFVGAAGARMHTYRIDGGKTRGGEATWVAGGGLAGWWRLGRYVTLEFGLRQRFAGRGWIHDVGVRRVGERGQSTTLVFAGVGWIGRRR